MGIVEKLNKQTKKKCLDNPNEKVNTYAVCWFKDHENNEKVWVQYITTNLEYLAYFEFMQGVFDTKKDAEVQKRKLERGIN